MNNNIQITNEIELNKEAPKHTQEDIMWEARRRKNRKLYTFMRNQLGLGKHWLQQKRLSKSRQWGGGK